MAVVLNVQGDFSDIVDGLEVVTLRRRGSSTTIPVAKAWRFSSKTEDPESANGATVRNDVQWQFEWDESNGEPRLGDTILDANNQCWTILTIEQLRTKTRYRCLTRNLAVTHGLDQRVDIQQAVWEDLGSGPEITSWRTVQAAVPARIQPDRLTVDNLASPATSTATYRIILEETLELDHDHRFVDTKGTVYQLLEFKQAERIDVLPVAMVEKQVAVP